MKTREMKKVKRDHIYFLTVNQVLFCYKAHARRVVVRTGLAKSLKHCYILRKTLKMKSLGFVVEKSLCSHPQALKFVQVYS